MQSKYGVYFSLSCQILYLYFFTKKNLNVGHTMTTLGYKNHKSCQMLPKFLPTLRFLQESHMFVKESKFLQDWNIALYFLQDTFAKFLSVIENFYKNAFLTFIISTKTLSFFRVDCVPVPKMGSGTNVLGITSKCKTGTTYRYI